ncbi:alpha/beta fold hydrolase [Paractinoplanes ferrugineus]|uniref:Thioesterase n=1 Tax=Paractinoplanes ferrugineus TaxID=113564 RepID=A0A919J308_9ACTN|nr:alpha/beta fold hydrolase [Actinoplanes ferrugineus]GIE12734.1 thioesterase [Actinoplanes ferrugineus]
MSTETWLRRYGSAPQAPHRLICLPHAGGSATFYHPVALALAPSVDVLAVQYPGRQDRRNEPFTATIQELAEQIVPAVRQVADRPLTFFGHSMGSTVAFEIVRQLQAEGIAVSGMFVSGRFAPSVDRGERVHEMSDAGVLAELRRLDGTDARMFDTPDIVEMIMPALRNDYRAIETYKYLPGPPLTCAVYALLGDADPKVNAAEMRAWAGHTTGPFTFTTFAGGHFYLTHHMPAILAAITAHIEEEQRTSA